MKNVKKQFMILCSIIFALLLVLSTASVSATQGNTWVTRASMATGRDIHQAVEVNGKIYIIGGSDGRHYINSLEEYDPRTNTWTTKAAMSTARGYHQVAVVGGKIYVIGGCGNSSGSLSSVEEYDPATDKWTTKAPMNVSRRYFQTAVIDTKIYAIGGDVGNGDTNSVEEYNPQTNTWSAKASLSTAREFHQAAVVGGKIYVLGGYGIGGPLDSVEEYDLTKNSWTAKKPLAARRYNFEAPVVGGKIYAIGGNCNTGTCYLSSTEEYDPATDTWVTKAPMAAERTNFESVVAEGKIYAMGGGNKVFLNSVEEYNPATNIWTTRASMAGPIFSFQAVLVNGKIYAIGGCDSRNYLNSVEEYTPITVPVATELRAAAGNKKVDLSWTAVTGSTSYNIKRSITTGGPYTTIVTGSAITYTDTSVTNGTTYYYTVSAVSEAGEGANCNVVPATPFNSDVTLEVTSVDKSKVGDEITANVVIHNAANICAEDIKVAFDTSKLQLIGAKGAKGIKIYKEDSLTEGTRRYITASLGKANAANDDKILLQLTFKTKASGEAKIDITNGRIADNATLEKDIEEKNCGEKIVLIEEKSKDVNRTGEFTLLDLGIDAWHYGDTAANTDTSKYDADVVANGTIDDDDLAEIVKQILSNSNYPIASK